MKKALLLLFALGTMTHIIAKAETTEHFVGGDISLLPSYEQYNTPYYDRDGKIVKRVTSSDPGTVEDPEQPTPSGGGDTPSGGGNTPSSGDEDEPNEN